MKQFIRISEENIHITETYTGDTMSISAHERLDHKHNFFRNHRRFNNLLPLFPTTFTLYEEHVKGIPSEDQIEISEVRSKRKIEKELTNSGRFIAKVLDMNKNLKKELPVNPMWKTKSGRRIVLLEDGVYLCLKKSGSYYRDVAQFPDDEHFNGELRAANWLFLGKIDI